MAAQSSDASSSTVPSSDTMTSPSETSIGAATTVVSSAQTTAAQAVRTTESGDTSTTGPSTGITWKCPQDFLIVLFKLDTCLNKQKSSF